MIYVPQYAPEMLYEPNYAWEPIRYYPDPYPYYYYPGATFFAGAVTGAIWAAAVDWDDWGVWGGRWNGGDIDIDCNNCFNNRDFNGKINFNDVDWKNVDRSQDQHRPRPVQQVRPQQHQEQDQEERRQRHPRPRQGHQEARQHRQQAAGRRWRGNEGHPQEHARRAEGPGRPGGQSAPQPS